MFIISLPSLMASSAAALAMVQSVRHIPNEGPGRKTSGLHRGWHGRVYPHSSARQQARYARQLAAGQLRFVGVK